MMDPKPVRSDQCVLSYNTEGGCWDNLSNCRGDPVPWNMVHCSAFRLDHASVGILWYDTDKGERILRAS